MASVCAICRGGLFIHRSRISAALTHSCKRLLSDANDYLKIELISRPHVMKLNVSAVEQVYKSHKCVDLPKRLCHQHNSIYGYYLSTSNAMECRSGIYSYDTSYWRWCVGY